jgi:uncharacterized membrane protein YgdD (TMEM256/DUF423 family)
VWLLAVITWKLIAIAAALMAVGTLLLLFSERIQVRLLKWHDDVRDKPDPSPFLLHLTGQHYEATMRLLGGLMILTGLILLLVTVIRDNLPS